ncbi:hypothetical protein ACROYT_G015409 [Oculina patagonica]
MRSKGKNKFFDEKGVFGSVCRHDFLKSFISIKHGERISYSVYEIQKLKEEVEPNVQIISMTKCPEELKKDPGQLSFCTRKAAHCWVFESSGEQKAHDESCVFRSHYYSRECYRAFHYSKGGKSKEKALCAMQERRAKNFK